ncbi:CASP-like protein 1 [Rutidosis leptorrhynchoides]|uniref:CASP-like protein 1 n=1 Tax=Rutidosis leptorrhynchoides TaxID=125765 RepID=UPI003A9A5351
MASIETGVPSRATTDAPVKWSSKLTRYVSDTGTVAVNNHAKVDVALRALVVITSLIAVIVMVTSKQKENIQVAPQMIIRADARFTHSPSFTYFVAAYSVTFLYGIFTGYSSYSALKAQRGHSTEQLINFALTDSLLCGIDAAATGAAGGVAYEALKGNPHIHWTKICHIFDKFCDHLAAAGFVSIVTGATLLLLVWLSICKIAKAR